MQSQSQRGKQLSRKIKTGIEALVMATMLGAVALSLTACGGGGGSSSMTGSAAGAITYSLWDWVGGSNGVNALGIYGTSGVAAPGNMPGGRYGQASWADQSGSLWMFGGYGYSSTSTVGSLNDLWKYDPATSQWTWMAGSNSVNSAGTVGASGVASTSYVPGARFDAAHWTDSKGNFWLFGGYYNNAMGTMLSYNDLWKFNPATREWTWVAGPQGGNGLGNYGALNTAAATNVPGARQGAMAWTDSADNLWMLGGKGYDAASGPGFLSDLWEYDTTQNMWIWRGGSSLINQLGQYGTLGSAAPGNMPGGRYGGMSWNDTAGNFWVLGGFGFGISSGGYLSDLWKYNTGTGLWTWMNGSDAVNVNGAYGTQGAASAVNMPGARYYGAGWTDASGNRWLFGGLGYGAAATTAGNLNDLWKYNPATNQWTWMAGSDVTNTSGSFGTSGVAAAGNIPGAMNDASSWKDGSGNAWLFGGTGYGKTGLGTLNNLWKVTP